MFFVNGVYRVAIRGVNGQALHGGPGILAGVHFIYKTIESTWKLVILSAVYHTVWCNDILRLDCMSL